MAVSDGIRLAPEEVYEKGRGEKVGEKELRREENQTLRKRKKQLAKLRQQKAPAKQLENPGVKAQKKQTAKN